MRLKLQEGESVTGVLTAAQLWADPDGRQQVKLWIQTTSEMERQAVFATAAAAQRLGAAGARVYGEGGREMLSLAGLPRRWRVTRPAGSGSHGLDLEPLNEKGEAMRYFLIRDDEDLTVRIERAEYLAAGAAELNALQVEGVVDGHRDGVAQRIVLPMRLGLMLLRHGARLDGHVFRLPHPGAPWQLRRGADGRYDFAPRCASLAGDKGE